MISVGINGTSNHIKCNSNNGFTPIKIGVDGTALAVSKILIGDENGFAREVYFNPLYEFRHTFDTGIQFILSCNSIYDRLASNPKLSDMTMRIVATTTHASYNPLSYALDSDDYNKSQELNEYLNVTKVIFENGSFHDIKDLQNFPELEFLEIGDAVSISELDHVFVNCPKLKTVIIRGIIFSAVYSMINLYDGAAILCFESISYESIATSRVYPQTSVVYNCVENVAYNNCHDGLICINNGTTTDNSIVTSTFINNFYSTTGFDNILGETT